MLAIFTKNTPKVLILTKIEPLAGISRVKIGAFANFKGPRVQCNPCKHDIVLKVSTMYILSSTGLKKPFRV